MYANVPTANGGSACKQPVNGTMNIYTGVPTTNGVIANKLPSNRTVIDYSRQKENEKQTEDIYQQQTLLAEEYSPSRRHNTLLSLVALLTCLVVALYVIVVYANQSSHHQEEEKTTVHHVAPVTIHDMNSIALHEVCLDCLKLVKNPYKSEHDPFLEVLTKRKEGDVMKCCAGNPVQMSAMLEAVARGQDTLKNSLPTAYSRIQKSSTVSIHKAMISETKHSLTDYNVVKFDPSSYYDRTEHRRGAILLEDGVVILTTGTYYIYSNVLFKGNGTGNTSHNEKWSSHIHRTSPESNTRTGILLTSVHTRCENCKEDILTSFTGGVFQLQAGDFIQVFLSDVGVVHFNNYSSYLGLVLICG